MAKREPKKTLKDKKNEGIQPSAPKKPEVQKVQTKGEIPSYTKNVKKEEEKERLVFAKKIADARILFPKFLQGVYGKYLVGINRTTESGQTESEAHTFIVRNHHVPEGYGRSAYDITVIEGDVRTHDGKTGVSIALPWMFKYPDECKMQPGDVGKIQLDMLLFLQEAMQDAIFDQKEREAETKATKILDGLDKQGLFLATSDGKNLERPQQQATPKPISPLHELIPGNVGKLFNFSDKYGKHCLVRYVLNDTGKTHLIIENIHPDHILSSEGVREGFILWGINLNKDKPIPDGAKFSLHKEHYRHLVLVREFFIKKLDNAFETYKARKSA